MDIHQDLAHLQVENLIFQQSNAVFYGEVTLNSISFLNEIEDGQVPSDNRFYYHQNILSIASLGVCYHNLVVQIDEIEYQDSDAQNNKYSGAVYKDFFEMSPEERFRFAVNGKGGRSCP